MEMCFRYINLTFCYHAMNSTEESLAFVPSDKDLHVFMPDMNNLINGLKHFSKIYSQRNWTSQEIWLLDVSAWTSIEDAKEILDDTIDNLDIDDDLYLYSYDAIDFSVTIWELYRKHDTMPTHMEFYGNWNEFVGLDVLVMEKWKRRGNLEVSMEIRFAVIQVVN